jgi:hypothetical protein
MKTSLLLAIVFLAGSGNAWSGEPSFRTALETIPPKYLGDIPLAHRERFLKTVEKGDERFDAKSGWLHWYSDGRDVRCTSMVWAKELPRPDKSPLVFVHMAKPFADGSKPAANQTFVMERTKDGWVDVTKKVMPAEVDLTMHFRTRRKDSVIEVAPWKQFERRDGRGKAWTFGSRVSDLEWKDGKFKVVKPASKTLTKN